MKNKAARLGLDREDVFVGSNLVDLYAKCGSLEDSRKAFDKMRAHSVVAWTSLILGCCGNGQPELALDLFSSMAGLEPDAPTFVAAINACSSLAIRERGRAVNGKVLKREALEVGRDLHARAAKRGFDLNKVVAGSLVDLYAKCGSIEEAIGVFERSPDRSAVSLTALMLGLVDNGDPEAALKIFFRSQSQKSFPLDAGAFVAALKACSAMAAREEGRVIDGKIVKVEALGRGRGLHSQVSKRGFQSDMFLASTLVDVYAKCGSLCCARRVFDGMIRHDVVSWTALLLGYAENGGGEIALELFASMKVKNYAPDARTFVAVFTALASIAEKEVGTADDQVGSVVKIETLKRGLELESETEKLGSGDVFLASSLIALYAKCGSLENARRVFDKIIQHDLASWTTMILGYVEKDCLDSAFDLFARMNDEGFEPDSRTFAAMLKACACLAAKEDAGEMLVKAEALRRGRDLHSQAAERGLDSDKFVACKIVEMYSRCGSMTAAREFFDSIPSPSCELRIELALGYFDNNEPELGMEMLQKLMRIQCYYLARDSRLFLAALKASGISASIETLRTVHAEVLRAGSTDEAVLNLLTDVYGKCSSTRDAQIVFDNCGRSDSVGWTSLISGYSRSGEIDIVLDLFRSMQDEHIRPDEVALTCVLGALSHAGLVSEGKQLLSEMESEFGIKPGVEHYVCMVDLLGRANHLDAALEMARSMPREPSALVWRTLLGACHKWKNKRVGQVAFEALVKLDKSDAAAYVLMTNLLRSQEETFSGSKDESTSGS